MIFLVSDYLLGKMTNKELTTTANIINKGIAHQPNSNMNRIKSNILDISILYHTIKIMVQ